MKLLDRILTPRHKGHQAYVVSNPLAEGDAAEVDAGSPATSLGSPRLRRLATALRLKKLGSSLSKVLTPRRHQRRQQQHGEAPQPAESSSPAGSPARTPPSSASKIRSFAGRSRSAVAEQQLSLGGDDDAASSPVTTLLSTPADSHRGDSASPGGSDASSLDGFGPYSRGLASVKEHAEAEGPGVSAAAAAAPSAAAPLPDNTLAQHPISTLTQGAGVGGGDGDEMAELTEQDRERGERDLHLFLKTAELPNSRHRLARLVMYADTLEGDAFADLSLQDLEYKRCLALLQQLLQPLAVRGRCSALSQLQVKLTSALLSQLGSSLERLLESERACQRFVALPFEVACWMLKTCPCDRGETIFDLANLWLEQQPRLPLPEQQRSLAALVWRRPLAADFLRCMSANLGWASQHVATSQLRPARIGQSLDGRFSFTADFELWDVLELQHAAMAEGRPKQQQSPAIYCGGYCWWAVLVANPRHNRFELYTSCTPFALFQEPFRASLQPAADVRFSFQNTTCLADWQQTNLQRVAAMHTHWGGPAFYAPATAPVFQAAAGRAGSSSQQQQPAASPSSAAEPPAPQRPMAAAARPDTARGSRPAAEPGRVHVPGGTADEQAGSSTAHVGVKVGMERYTPASDGALTARGERDPADAPLQQLTMNQLVAVVRQSCPYSWGASLRVRVNLKLLG